MTLVMVLILILVAVDVLLSALMFGERYKVWREARNEEAVEDAVWNEREEARRSVSMDQGFENIMQFQVDLGRGLHSGGEP